MSNRSNSHGQIGQWRGEESSLKLGAQELRSALDRTQDPLYVVSFQGQIACSATGQASLGGELPESAGGGASAELVSYLPALPLDSLGDRSFCEDHGLRFPYVAGAMANGIASVKIVEEMAKHGMLGFFGSAGLPKPQVEAAIERLQESLGDKSFGVNLIHNPNEPHMEDELVDLFIEKKLHLVEASAYLRLTPAVVRYRIHGIHEDANGNIVTPNKIIAKVSRVEVASRFFAPPPEKILSKLVDEGKVTPQEAELARRIPLAQDVTAESDSGGHTDNRPALALLPTLASLRDRMQEEHSYGCQLRVGAAGGIATPASAAASFAMGAAYLLVGSIHQACLESGTSDIVRGMLAAAKQADVIMAPAADMFEMGVNVQVLKRGSMFAMRGRKLYEIYRSCDSMDQIPAKEREGLEKDIFRAPLNEIWEQTRTFFLERDPRQIERAERDPKHQMALVFRWYLGLASFWANRGVEDRKMDYQVWCGPAMGAFNEWVSDTDLAKWETRKLSRVAMSVLHGGAVAMRLQQLRQVGVELSAEQLQVPPLSPQQCDEIYAAYLGDSNSRT